MEITEQYRKLACFYDGVLKEESLAPECSCLKYCILGKKKKKNNNNLSIPTFKDRNWQYGFYFSYH